MHRDVIVTSHSNGSYAQCIIIKAQICPIRNDSAISFRMSRMASCLPSHVSLQAKTRWQESWRGNSVTIIYYMRTSRRNSEKVGWKDLKICGDCGEAHLLGILRIDWIVLDARFNRTCGNLLDVNCRARLIPRTQQHFGDTRSENDYVLTTLQKTHIVHKSRSTIT